MVFETALVSALSAGFYAAMAVALNYPLSTNRLLLFAFLGSSLYMIFGLMTSLAKVLSKLMVVPKTLIKYSSMLISKLRTPEHVKNHRNLSKKVRTYTDKVEELSKKLEQDHTASRKQKDVNEDNDNDNEVKEVVLNKVKEDKNEDDDDDDDKDNDSEEFRL